jgi:mannonate dehydratase
MKQIGVDDVRIGVADVPGYTAQGYLDVDSAREVKRRLEQIGLRWGTLYLAKLDTANLLLDRPGWQAELDKVCRTLEAMGRVGIPVLEHSLLLSRVIRDTTGRPLPGHWVNPNGRGGAHGQSFEDEGARAVADLPAGAVSADQMWERIPRFQNAVFRSQPARACGLPVIGRSPGVKRYWGRHAGVEHAGGAGAADQHRTPNTTACSCAWAQCRNRCGHVLELIRHFGGQKKIFDIDFRSVRGTIPRYDEVFLDEGDLDMWKVVQTHVEIDYEWTIEPDHLPGVIDDRPGGPASYAWAIGYMKGPRRRRRLVTTPPPREIMIRS